MLTLLFYNIQYKLQQVYIMLNINSKEDLKNIYYDIKNDINDILIDASNVNMEKEEDTIFIMGLIKEMEKLNKKFDEDIDFLEKNAEWEKFTIAFFWRN